MSKETADTDKTKKGKVNDDKKNKKESSVKYEFKKPEDDILKIIPFCNNIFYIRKNEA
jgi:hypothetical protein